MFAIPFDLGRQQTFNFHPSTETNKISKGLKFDFDVKLQASGTRKTKKNLQTQHIHTNTQLFGFLE